MNRPVVVGLVALLVCAGVAPAAGVHGETRLAAPGEFTQTTFTVEVFENGTAEWTIQYSRPLNNESEREQFRTFAEQFETSETRLYSDFVNRSRALASKGRNVTGREMTASNFGRSATVEQFTSTRGVVRMSFRWSALAVVDGQTVVVADVFEGGLYVGPDQQLVFEAGPGLAFVHAEPESYRLSGETLAASDTVTYVGEEQFTDNHPRVELRPQSAVGTDEGTTDGGPSQTPAQQGGGGTWLVVGLIAAVLGLVGVVAWRSNVFGRRTPSPAVDEPDAGGGGGATTAASDTAGDEGSAAAASPIEEELITDEDRVRNLLEEHGGRMKQVEIVDQTDWSKSKVSMLLSDMEEDGEISKLRVGRENIISLAGHEPDAAGSPFDDEE